MVEQNSYRLNLEAEAAEAIEKFEERHQITMLHDLAQWENSQHRAEQAIYRHARFYFSRMGTQHFPWYRKLPDDPAARDIVQFYYGDEPPGLRASDAPARVKLFETMYWNLCLVKGMQSTVSTK